jgi:outer membrane protein TolC
VRSIVVRASGRISAAVAAALLWAALPASAQDGAAVDFGEAMRRLVERSGSIQGAELDYQAKRLQAAALRRIDGPDLRLTGFAGRIATTLSVDTSRIGQVLEPALQLLPPLPGLELPALPPSLDLDRVYGIRSLGLASAWPLYTGGRLEAVKDVAAGRAQEAGAAVQAARDEAAVQLAQRYFGVQLARKARLLRDAAVTVAKEHQAMARKLERTGLIAKVERLKADVAVDNAVREASKAAGDLEIAQVALQRMLGERGAVVPTTPLFVHERAVGTLASFIDAATASNAAWKQIDSKRTQAAANLRLQGQEYSPTVLGVANYNLNRGGTVRANWLVGVAFSMPLFDRIDRAKAIAAARLEQQRVEVAAEQAGRDIPTLVEKQWRTMEDARRRYLAMGSTIELAREMLRLAQVSFKNAQATSADVDDASLNLTKSSIEQAQAAYDYVVALAQLLDSAGAAGQLAVHAHTADHLVAFAKE